MKSATVASPVRYPVEKSPYRKFRERPHEIGGCRLNARVVVRLWQAAGSRKSPVAKAAVDVAHRHARLRQSTHLPRGSPSVLTSPSPVGIAGNQTTHGRFLYFGLVSQRCNALTDKGKRSNKDWGAQRREATERT